MTLLPFRAAETIRKALAVWVVQPGSFFEINKGILGILSMEAHQKVSNTIDAGSSVRSWVLYFLK